MNEGSSRREFLGTVAAGAAGIAVVGWSESARAWVPQGASGSVFARIPHLDGELVTDAATRAQFGQDLGFIVFKTPSAVLRPGSIEDVARMIRFCRRYGIHAAARGQGHSTDGQSQVEAGLVIEMRTLGTIHEVGSGYAIVDGGATWYQLLERTLTTGQTPPVLTGFIGLSIGGTLSMGGMSGMAYDTGPQVEHVEELTVVTGRGDVVVCSRRRNRALFDAVLAGVGQYGIIVRAKIRLVPAAARANDLTIVYRDFATFMADMRTLIARAEYDMVWGGFKRDPASGTWSYELYTTSFYDPPNAPNNAHLLRGLHFDPANVVEIDGTYWEYQTRVDGVIAFLKSLGVWDGFMHPWFDCFLPDRSFDAYVQSTLASLTAEDIGNFGFVLMFPLKTAHVDQPMFRLPDDDLVFLFDINNAANAPGFDPDYAARMQARNRALYERAKAVGGRRYPIGTLNFTPADWRHHYGSEWVRAQVSKTYFDPDHILTPGPRVFDEDC